MKSFLTTALLAVFVIGLSGATNPDDRYAEFWECKLKEGKTIEAVHAANSKWVTFMNANVEGGDIRSYVLTPQVGERKPGHFMFVDSFPSLEAWAAGEKAIETEAGKVIQAEINELITCWKNTLHKSRQS